MTFLKYNTRIQPQFFNQIKNFDNSDTMGKYGSYYKTENINGRIVIAELFIPKMNKDKSFQYIKAGKLKFTYDKKGRVLKIKEKNNKHITEYIFGDSDIPKKLIIDGKVYVISLSKDEDNDYILLKSKDEIRFFITHKKMSMSERFYFKSNKLYKYIKILNHKTGKILNISFTLYSKDDTRSMSEKFYKQSGKDLSIEHKLYRNLLIVKPNEKKILKDIKNIFTKTYDLNL